MKGGPSKEPLKGFTIVETLIVLAVTGAILISALALINGRQSRTQFTVGIGQVQQQVQQVISEVKNGYYPNNGNITCVATASGPYLTQASNGQGQNGSCIFLGKAIQFWPSGQSDQMTIIPIAANRLGGNQEVTNLPAAKPVAIAPLSATDSTTPDATEKRAFGNGIHVVDMWRNGNRSDKIGAVAILFSLASYDSQGLLTPGALQTSLYTVNGTRLNTATTAVATAIKGTGGATGLDNTANQVSICFASSTTKQSGLLTIGGATGKELSVNMTIMAGTAC